jgi:hypothetical protein
MPFSYHDHMEQATHAWFDVRFHCTSLWYGLITVIQNKITCENVSPILAILVICILLINVSCSPICRHFVQGDHCFKNNNVYSISSSSSPSSSWITHSASFHFWINNWKYESVFLRDCHLFRGVNIDGVWIGELHLLTTYTHTRNCK